MHIKKLNLQATMEILRHDFRQNKNYSNKDIDLSKSVNNTIFCNNDIEYLKNRTNEIYIFGKNGKYKNDINYTCSVVVQYPKNCEISENDFFKCMNYLLNKKFGKNNCICSVVHHNDENEKGRPHLHYVFMPVVKMKTPKKGYTEKLCAKEVVNREMLLKFHSEMEQGLKELTGKDIKLTTNESRDYIKDMDEYKQTKEKLSKANQQIKELNEKCQNGKKAYNELVKKYNNEQEKYKKLQDTNKALQDKNDDLGMAFNKLVDEFNNLQDALDIVRNYFNKYYDCMLSIKETEMQKDLQIIDERLDLML